MTTTSQTPAGTQAPSANVSPAGGLGPLQAPAAASLAPSPDPVLNTGHSDFAEFHEGYVRNYIGLADTKATMLFGASAGLLTYLFGKDAFHNTILSPAFSFAFSQTVMASVFLGLSAACALLVIVPRLGHSQEGIVFFGAVASYPSATAYLDQVAHRSESELTAARIKHCYDISRVCTRKYDMLRRAIWFGAMGLIATLTIIGDL